MNGTTRVPWGFCVLIVALIWGVPEAQAAERDLRATADAMIAQGTNAADPNANPEYVAVGTRSTSDGEKYRRLLVRFDLGELPEGAEITEAELRLRRAYQEEEGEGLEDKTIKVSAYRLLKDWKEGRPDGASWRWGARDEIDWTLPGADATTETHPDRADRAADPTDTYNALDISHGVHSVWDVTADVQAMHNGEVENHGWILIGPEVDQGVDWVRYRTRENAQQEGSPEYSPTLRVNYLTAEEAKAKAAIMQLRPTKGEIVPTMTTPSLLANGDFENGLEGWTISSEQNVVAEHEIVETEHGSALQIRRLEGDDPIRIISDPIAVDPGTAYMVTGLYQTTDAGFGSLAEFKILQGTEPEMTDKLDAWITKPGRYGHVGHWTMFNRPADEWERKTRSFQTWSHTRYIRLAITLEGPPSTILFDNIRLAPPEEDNREWSWPQREEPMPRDEAVAALESRPDSTAEVKHHEGMSKLHVDGKPVVPQINMADVINSRRGFVRDFGEHSINLHIVAPRDIWTGKGEYDFDEVDEVLWNAVARNPDGHFIVYISARPYRDWHEEHPEHAAQNSAGEYATSRHGHYAPPSYWSPEYQRQAFEMLEAYVDHVNAQPYSRAIVGYFLTGGEDGQFYYQVRGQRALQDGNAPGAQPLLTEWLRERYPDVEELRDAWGDPELTHETAQPPIKNERYSATFFDPATQRKIADFQRFLNEEMGHFLSEMGRICKATSNKPVVVGAYYGRGNSFMVYPHFAQTSVMFDSPWIDYMGAQPGYYGYREAGTIGHVNWVIDSLRLHGKLPMTEQDFRTWVMQFKSLNHDFKVARYWHLDELRGAVRRGAGRQLSIGGGLWWMEMTGGWFHDPEIMEMLEEVSTTSQSFYESKAEYTPADIVFVTDEDNFSWTTEQVNIWNGPTFHAVNVQQRAIYRSGLKFNHYYLSDLIEHGMDDHKVYIFLNQFYLDEEEKQFIETRLKRDGKVLVWQYAPGYLTPNGFSTEAMAELTGMRITTEPEIHEAGLNARFMPEPSGPLSRQLLANEQGQQMGYGIDLPAQRFTVTDDEAEILATYTEDGRAAAAAKRMDDYTSLFIGHPSGFTPTLLQNIARLGDVHIYLEPGNMFMFHRDDLIVLHGIEGGSSTLHLPFEADISDAFTGELLASDANTLPIELTVGETRWLRIER